MSGPRKKADAPRYRVKTGLNYGAHDARIEASDEPRALPFDFPEASIPWLLAQGHLELVKE